jgi:hypothetical protein
MKKRPAAIPCDLSGSAPAATFAGLAGTCVRRFLRQNGRPPLPEELLGQFGARLWTVASEAGWARPLAAEERGEPTEMPADRAAELTGRVMAGLPFPDRHADLEIPARQLLKACLQPEFRQCRESYREVVDGACRRQELPRARGRISGAHCVDCPYWVGLEPGQHAALLARSWVEGGPEKFATQREIFLPEDYRALRVFLWQQARSR